MSYNEFCFQYIDDLIEGLLALMESDYTKPVNVGNPDEYTIDKFATKVQQTVVDQLGPDYTSHVVYQANSRTLNDPQVMLGL